MNVGSSIPLRRPAACVGLLVAVALGLLLLSAVLTAAPARAAAGAPVAGVGLVLAPPLLGSASLPETTAYVSPEDWSNEDVYVDLSADSTSASIVSIWYRIDSGTPVTVNDSYVSFAVPAKADHSNDGQHTITFHATDDVGGVEANKTCVAKIDTSGPGGSFKLGDGSGATTSRQVEVDLSGLTDLAGVDSGYWEYSVDAKVTWNPMSASSSTIDLPAGLGPKTVWGKFTDVLGNESTLSQTITRTANTTPPEVEAIGWDLSWHTSPVTVSINGWVPQIGGLGGITYSVDGGAPTTVGANPGTNSLTVPVVIPAPTDGSNNGVHTIAFSAGNADGYSSETKNVTVNIGPTPAGFPLWTDQTPAGTKGLLDVDFVSTTKGWAVGYGGTILATTDGGAHWVPQASGTTEDLLYVSFGDASHGWALSDSGHLFATANAGTNWTAQSLGSATLGTVGGLDAVDATHVWALGDEGPGGAVHILASSTGGATWSEQPITGGLTGYVRGIEFVDQQNGWAFAATFTPNFAGVILHTTDGGAHWTRQTTTVASKPWDVFALDVNHVWFSGYENQVTVRTADGGATWQSFTEGYAATELEAIRFTDALNGWAGTHVGLYRSIDGGATWQPFLARPDTSFPGLDTVDASHAWAVGTTYNAGGTTTGTILSLSVSAAPAKPAITTVSPGSGPVGQSVVITGTGFGATKGTSTVKFGATAATVTAWSATSITATVPAGLALGAANITVTTSAGSSAAASFTVTGIAAKPALTKLSPAQGRIGVVVTLTGKNFGVAKGTSTVKFGAKAVTKYVSWSATKIKVKVPKGTVKGKVKVTVKTAAGTSAAKTFKRL